MPCGDRYIKLMCYLADLTILLYEDHGEFEKRIERLFKVVKTQDGYWVASSSTKVYITPRADPYANLSLLGFALFGAYWPFMPDADDAFKHIRQWHREKIKQENEVKI